MSKNVDGLVSQMNRITATVNAYKVVAAAAVVAAAVACVACVYLYTAEVRRLQSRIYVLDDGRSFSAHGQDQSVTRADEVRDQVRTFHGLMFNIAPSTDMIRHSLERAFTMCDKSAYRYYNDLQESGFYKRLTSTNSYQQIELESIDVDTSVYPFAVTARGSQYITRESNISKFSLVTRCRVANAVRTPENLHGLMIEDFEVVENKLIETRDK